MFSKTEDLYLHVHLGHNHIWKAFQSRMKARESKSCLCIYCGRGLQSEYHLRNHGSAIFRVLSVQRELILYSICFREQIKVQCSFLDCKSRFKTADELMSHLGTAHQTYPFSRIKLGVYESNHRLIFADQVYYEVHQPVIYDRDQLLVSPQLQTTITRLLHRTEWKCATCNYGFASLEELGKHWRPKMDCLPFQCRFCLELSTTIMYYRNHMLAYAISLTVFQIYAHHQNS